MITVEESKRLVTIYCSPLSPVMQDPIGSLHSVLAETIFSPIDMPSFNQSGVDGYAIRFEEYTAGASLKVTGEIQAGGEQAMYYKENNSIRIFTGSNVPAGYDTVVMQEYVTRKDDELFITSPTLSLGSNVRPQGSEIKKGAIALEKGSLLTPGAIGFLASLGITSILVYPKPLINIIVTGKELQQPGVPLSGSQVYESNSVTLKSALQQLHFPVQDIQWMDDDLEQMKTAVADCLHRSDLLLITGGVSVGDYDFVVPALADCGVETIFHKVKQRPGKPLYFGKTQTCIVFGLPGNPSSVLTCFYEYVLIALQQLTNRSQPLLQELTLPMAAGYTKPAGLTHFLKGIYTNGEAKPLTAQESYRLSSFALANCLIKLSEEATEVKKGDKVNVHILPA